MIRRAVFLADGSSDEPLSEHLEVLCARRRLDVRVTTPHLRSLPNSPGLSVPARLNAVLEVDNTWDILFVHRDAEGQDPNLRFEEVENAVAEIRPDLPAVAIVPIRMTEAWLLLNEEALRTVAGRPNSTVGLGLPPISRIEGHADPKSLLKQALDTASELSGRRLHKFQARFGDHRRILLQRLDLDGPVRQLSAWQTLESSLDELAGRLTDS